MAENVNTESVFTGKTFITLDTLSYFWTKTKAHVDGLVNPISGDVTALKNTVGNATSGLVKEVASLRADVTALGSGEGGIQGMIDNSIAALDLPNTYDANGAAANALTEAKSYVDGKVDGKFDAAGAAANALTEAKSYVDSKVDGKFDAAGAAAEVDGKLTTHADDAVAHVTADERTAWNSAKTAIDAFLKDADMTADAVDTLKELQTYMTTDGTAATELVNRVKTLEDSKDAYIEADKTVLADAKSYVDSKVDGKFDTAGAAATAKTEAIADAKTYVDGKVDGKFDASGAAADALTEAKSYVDGKVDDKFDAAGAAAQALTDAKTYVDGKVDGKFDVAGSADAAQTAAIAQAKLDAAEALKLYYTKTEVNNLLSTNSTGDRAYAKQYTDELYKSFVFAQSSDIDAIFATTNA